MQIAANNNLVLTEFPSLNGLADLRTTISFAKFYQQITRGVVKGFCTRQILAGLGNSLISLAEHAYSLRRMDVVEQAGGLLSNLPVGNRYRSVGRYYSALCVREKGQIIEARILLERLLGELPAKFRAKTLIALAKTFYGGRDFKSALSLCVEASRAAAHHEICDPQTFITAQRNIALLKSFDGNHHGAVEDLKGMFPLIRAVSRRQPYLLYEHLNSYAVELGEVGRLEEAQNICRIVLASPYASAYPEWRETCNELHFRGYRTPRSFVPVTRRALNTENVLPLPAPERDAGMAETAPDHPRQPARVLDYVGWIKQMVKEPNGKQNDEPKTTSDRLVKLLRMVNSELSDADLDKVIELLKQLHTKKKP